jgi:hypothetical protein
MMVDFLKLAEDFVLGSFLEIHAPRRAPLYDLQFKLCRRI